MADKDPPFANGKVLPRRMGVLSSLLVFAVFVLGLWLALSGNAFLGGRDRGMGIPLVVGGIGLVLLSGWRIVRDSIRARGR